MNIIRIDQKIRGSSLKIIFLKCPYADWFNPQVQEMFKEVITLKLSGYQNKHFFGVMPVDGSDLISDHILVCSEEKNGDLKLLMGAKSLPYEICDLFHADFTIEKMFKSGGNKKHLDHLYRIIESCKNSSKKLSYYSSWTILPEARKDPKMVNTLKEIYAAFTYFYHRDQQISEIVGIGLPKFKTDTFFNQWGFESVQVTKPEEEKLILPSFGGIDAVFLHLKSFSTYALDMAQKYENLWKNKISLGLTVDEKKSLIAA